jgi:hypothetical protein
MTFRQWLILWSGFVLAMNPCRAGDAETIELIGESAVMAFSGESRLSPVEGDFQVTARLGVASFEGERPEVGLVVQGAEGETLPQVFFGKRGTDDWITFRVVQPGQTKPASKDLFLGKGDQIRFLRLLRTGNKLTAQYSGDAVFWRTLAEEEVGWLLEEAWTGPQLAFPRGSGSISARIDDLTVSAPDLSPKRFAAIPPESPSLTRFQGPLRLPKHQLQPESEQNPFGYRTASPWPGTYRNPDPLIPGLDARGPDGFIYPDWRKVGIPGGIPNEQKVVATIPPTVPDFAGALESAVKEAAAAGGGVIQLESGDYQLKRPVVIRANNIVLRGRGTTAAGTTRIAFAYGLGEKEIRWMHPSAEPPATTVIGPTDLIEVHADLDSPADGQKGTGAQLRLLVNGVQKRILKWEPTETGRFRTMMSGASLLAEDSSPGPVEISAEVTWKDGTTSSSKRLITLQRQATEEPFEVGAEAAIQFIGREASPRLPLPAALNRGDTSMAVPPSLSLQPGDFVMIHAGPSAEWMTKVRAVPLDRGGSSLFRRAIVQIASVADGTVTFSQPLRQSFELDRASTVQKLDMVRRSGVEDLVLASVEKNWLHGILFVRTAECWVKNVHFLKPGRNGFWTRDVKWCEARDVEFHDAWFKGGGGTAYVGWESAHDCLMDGVTSSQLRHGPNMQWSTSGCVIRNGEFDDSDGQFHAGWPTENLIENCTIRSRLGNGSYGYGFFIVGPESHIHGPQGPRNVLYNNNIESDQAGLWIGGSNEAYLFLYNRVAVKQGPAVLLKYGAFDHTFHGNVFQTREPVPSAVFIVTPDCTGLRFTDNRFYGVVNNDQAPGAMLFAGAIAPSVDEGNELLPFEDAPRPSPAVPSIFEWQRQNP